MWMVALAMFLDRPATLIRFKIITFVSIKLEYRAALSITAALLALMVIR